MGPDHIVAIELENKFVLSTDIVVGQNLVYGGGGDETILYSQSEEFLSVTEITEILTNPDEGKVSVLPPQKPKGGDIYLISDEGDEARQKDWSVDGYVWINKGRYSVPSKNPVYYVRRYDLSREKGDAIGTDRFQRKVYWINGSSLKLVHYRGDETLYVPRPHGNDKRTDREYRRTMPSVLETVRQRGVYQAPHRVYQSLVSKAVKGPYLGVSNPRNTEQVRNVQRQLHRQKRLTQDEIFSTLQLAYHVPGMINEITVFPDLSIIISHVELIEELKKVLVVKSDEPALLSYDTTFNIGDFYVSALVFKHVLFQGGVGIPVAFLVHDRISGELHDKFWDKMVKLVPSLNKSGTIIVTDRERAIRNAILKNAPQCRLFHCWNHVKRNVRHWLNTHGGTSDDQIVYRRDVEQLMKSENEAEFDEEYSERSVKWDPGFKDYFDSSLKMDIKTYCARWLIEDAGVFDPYSGVTSNSVESMHVVIKRLTEWKSVPIDSVCLSLHFLQIYYRNELLRGFCDVGNFRLKPRHTNASMDRGIVDMPADICEPDEIVNFVRGCIDQESNQEAAISFNGNTKHPETDSDMSEEDEIPRRDKPTSQHGLARQVLQQRKITMVPEAKCFIVEDNNGDKFSVQLFPKESCQCSSLGVCYHILAARMSVGLMDVPDTKICNLTHLRKRARKKPNKRAGSKKPRPCDEREISVIPAPDSEMGKGMSFAASTPHFGIKLPEPVTPTSIMKKSKKKTPKSRKKIAFADDDQTETHNIADDDNRDFYNPVDEMTPDREADTRRPAETVNDKKEDEANDENFNSDQPNIETEAVTKTTAHAHQPTTEAVRGTSPNAHLPNTDVSTTSPKPDQQSSKTVYEPSTKTTDPKMPKADTILSEEVNKENSKIPKEKCKSFGESPSVSASVPKNPARSKLKEVQNLPPLTPSKNRRVWLQLNETAIIGFKEKQDIQFDQKLCCSTMNFAQEIARQQFPQMNGFQYTGYAPLYRDKKWEYSLQMTSQQPPSVQIHHTGHDHWITSFQDQQREVYVLDSKNPRHTLSGSTEIQLSKVYGNEKNILHVKIPPVQQQGNSVDCGVFAIAFMVEVCVLSSVKGLSNTVFDTDMMRPHLIHCFNSKKFSPFPKKKHPSKLKLNRSVVFSIDKSCRARCNLPDMFDNLVCCDLCGGWFHYGCIDKTRQESFSDSRIFHCYNCAW